MISIGSTREANALLKIVLNSLSRPPMPSFSKSQFGLISDCCCTLPFDLPVRLMKAPSSFSKITAEFGVSTPTLIFCVALSPVCGWITSASISEQVHESSFLLANLKPMFWPLVNACCANCMVNSRAIRSVSYGSGVVLLLM